MVEEAELLLVEEVECVVVDWLRVDVDWLFEDVVWLLFEDDVLDVVVVVDVELVVEDVELEWMVVQTLPWQEEESESESESESLSLSP